MMKPILLVIVALLVTDPMKIHRVNKMKQEAKDAFQSGDYKTAIARYNVLIDSLGIREDEMMLNRAHALYLEKDTANAITQYQSLTQSPKNEVASRARNQIGLMTNQKGKPEEALNHFRQALKADPANYEARYNYEMLKKKLEKQKNEEQKRNEKDKNKDQNKKQEPSEFAKKLKEQADKLVAERKYRSAYNLMMDGLKKDQTVSTYQQYIDRIKDVDHINQ